MLTRRTAQTTPTAVSVLICAWALVAPGGAHEAAIREVIRRRGLLEPTPEPRPDFGFPFGG